MPLNPVAMSGVVVATGSGLGLLGSRFKDLSDAVSAAVVAWLKQATVTTIDVGVVGIAAANGTGLIANAVPPPLEGLLLAQFAGNGFLGPSAPSLAKALATGVAVNTATAQVSTSVPVMGPGAGQGLVVPKPNTVLEQLVVQEFSARQMVGSMTPNLARAIGAACFAWASTLQVVVVDVGVPLIVPPGTTVPGGSQGTGVLQ